MKKVVLRGPVLTQSGYGVHCRQVAKWLLNKPGIDVKFMALPWGDTPWFINSSSCDGLIGRIMERTVKPDHKADVSFQLQLPNEWDTSIAPVNVGMTAAVETDRANPLWVKSCNAMDLVIVPSSHAKASLTNAGEVTKPLIVIPESYNEDIVGAKPLDTEFSTSFNFLVFGQVTGNNPHNDRKNIFYTLKWLCETFKDDPDVGIIIKTNGGRNSRIDRQVIMHMMKSLTTEVRPGLFPKIHLLHGEMSDKEVAGLYLHPTVKALVTLTRGEGYGLPILEAAASGLPVIATNWSGHLDFLRAGKFVSISYQLSEIHASRVDNNIFVKGARWASPSEEDFKKRVLKFRTSPTTPGEWAADLRSKVIESHSLQKICEAYDAATREIL